MRGKKKKVKRECVRGLKPLSTSARGGGNWELFQLKEPILVGDVKRRREEKGGRALFSQASGKVREGGLMKQSPRGKRRRKLVRQKKEGGRSDDRLGRGRGK